MTIAKNISLERRSSRAPRRRRSALAPARWPPAQKQYWEGVNRKLADPTALTASIEAGHCRPRDNIASRPS